MLTGVLARILEGCLVFYSITIDPLAGEPILRAAEEAVALQKLRLALVVKLSFNDVIIAIGSKSPEEVVREFQRSFKEARRNRKGE